MKYLIIEVLPGMEVPVIFSNVWSHEDFAFNKKVISAGSVEFEVYLYSNKIYAVCNGRSPGLNLI